MTGRATSGGHQLMRKIATLSNPVNGIRRVMLYAADRGTYLFLYTRADDGPCEYDHWFETQQDGEQAAAEEFGVKPEDWVIIDDPVPGAQHDWIRPTRVKCDAGGKKLWGQFEALPPGG